MEDFNEGVDGKLAFRMRRVNPEQFHTLVRMHLSFELDLNPEDNDCVTEKAKLKKWGLPSFTKKPKSTMSLQKGPEGAILSEEGINQIKQLIVYLSKEQCLEQEGIFRRTGKLTRQQELKNCLQQNNSLNLEDGQYSVHDCASVLKGYLSDLHEPLLTDLHYPAHCQLAELCSTDAKSNDLRLLRSLQLLLLLLPSSNRIVLKHLLTLLHKTASYEYKNKMNCDTLATLFTPHLLCPRKLTPEALHTNSQNLSCLSAFMIRKDTEMFDIPPKLATDIRAYWVEQERKLISPKSDQNECVPDATGTAHTVFSFVDHKLTAKANSTEDTQAALAQLYAHIQAMPESAKKRRLVKQFNKENGQGTPRQVKNQPRTKSLGDSIKKHIFQKRILGHKKLIDINIGCNIQRSSSEETISSMNLEKPVQPTKAGFSKSDDELNMEKTDDPLISDKLFQTKHISNNASSFNTPTIPGGKGKNKVKLLKIVNNEEKIDEVPDENEDKELKAMKEKLQKQSPLSKKQIQGMSKYSKGSKCRAIRFSRHQSEPADMYSNRICNEIAVQKLFRHDSEPGFTTFTSIDDDEPEIIPIQHMDLPANRPTSDLVRGVCSTLKSPHRKPSIRAYAQTSTPANILQTNYVANDLLTPASNSDNSMSPITQSATKMTKAMQETMMTPRSRKPVMMVSASNLCNLAKMNNSWSQTNTPSLLYRSERRNHLLCTSILEETSQQDSVTSEFVSTEEVLLEDKENAETEKHQITPAVGSGTDDCCPDRNSSLSITNTFREYLLSRSVLTASPVDLSFTSRTGDFEQSESDLNILNEDGLSDSLLCCLDGNTPESDTSGVISGSTNSANNSSEIIEEVPSPRKRCTSLQRNDSKRSNSKTKKRASGSRGFKHKQLSESMLNTVKVKDTFQETSF